MHGGNDELGEIDLDAIDDSLWDDLLTDIQDTEAAPVTNSKRSAPVANPNQRTLDSMFGFKSNRSPSNQQAKRPTQSTHGLDRAESPAHPPTKVIRIEDDIIDLDFDMDDLDFVDEPPKPSAPITTPKQPPALPLSHRPLMFQARELVIKNTGDNTLVEATHSMNHEEMDTFTYPLLGGQPARAYQQGAIQHCLFQNTLVALPTGMGKTLIAAVVMANYARWFPDSMSIFLAPTKPLVAQQMQACRGMIRALYNRATQLSGTSSSRFGDDWVAEMNGQTLPKKRKTLWATSRFVFSTPQILQNDLKTGTLDTENAKRIVLLVIDEAHRATGRYAYGESIDALHSLYHGSNAAMLNPAQPCRAAPFRVMALTATPGSKISAVDDIVQRLHIAHIFLRTEESIDVVPYIHGRQIEEVAVDLPPWLVAARDCLASLMQRSINILCNTCKAMPNPGDLRRLSGYQVRMDRDRFMNHPRAGGMDIGRISGEFTVVISLAHIMQLLSEHGLRPALTTLRAWDQEVARARQKLGSTTRAKSDCVSSKEWETLMREFNALADMLDGKPLPSSSSTTSIRPTGPPATTTPVRTDVVSSFFNVSSTRSAAGGRPPAATGAPQLIATMAPPGTLGHPKLERLLEIVRTHFDKHGAEGGSTRIIVFSQYRGSVSEIVSVLDRLRPVAKTEAFIGQSSTSGTRSSKSQSGDSTDGSSTAGGWRGRGRGRGRGWNRGRGGASRFNGSSGGTMSSNAEDDSLAELDIGDAGVRGQTQKEQLAVLDRFRQGTTNIIVATCVGEEGLDIGEVDLIVNYDAPSSPIRLLQRIGRTGRARRGKVIVFLAKDTREENSYKKAQREYKSVQARIAEGRGINLRADLSPPMLPPSLPPGAPKRIEIDISKAEIAQADDASRASSSGAKGAAAKGKRGTAAAGIRPEDMDEYARLSYIFQRPNNFGEGGAQRVSQLLARGLAWQSAESPTCLVGHSSQSIMYQQVMLGLENARFNRELDGDSARESGFQLPNIAARARIGDAQLLGVSGKSRSAEKRSRAPRRSPPAGNDDTRRGAKFPTGNKEAAMELGSSPLQDDFLFGSDPADHGDVFGGISTDNTHRPPPAPQPPPPKHGSTAAAKRPTHRKKAAEGLAAKPLGAHHRRNSSQSNIFESIEKLVKSGKAKYAFDWSTAPDTDLLADAQARGIDLELADTASEKLARPAAPVATQSIFGDIGSPGTFTSLYDEDRLRQPLDQQPDQRRQSTPAKADAHDSDVHVLCSATPEALADIAILDDMGAFDLSSLDNFQVSAPPTPPGSAAALVPQPAASAIGRQTESADEIMIVDSPAAAATADHELLEFELGTSDIVVLSDEDMLGHSSKPGGLDSNADALASEPATPVIPRLGGSQRRPGMRDLDTDMSSSPLVRQRRGRRANRDPASSGAHAGDGGLQMLPSSSPQRQRRRLGSRLVRGREIAVDSESNSLAEPASSPLRFAPAALAKTKKKKKRGLRRPPPRQANNKFFDAEAAIGFSDDDDDGNPRRQAQASDDEADGDDLDQDLSSFIVDDDHVEFDSPATVERSTDRAQSDQQSPNRQIGDIYRRSLLSQTTPVSEIMRRLAEREQQRRWADETPTRGAPNRLLFAGDNPGLDDESIDSGSSDFERASDLFTHAA
ncbi:3'-5' DNA helicase [Coemansia sp. RSA 2705]|nr:3'-5' DNA helicase [Coemansia sp. RSA 2705]